MRKTENESENKENESIVDYILKIRPDFYDPIPVQNPLTGEWSDGIVRNPRTREPVKSNDPPLAAIKICQGFMKKTGRCPCCGSTFFEGCSDEEDLYSLDDIRTDKEIDEMRKESDVK